MYKKNIECFFNIDIDVKKINSVIDRQYFPGWHLEFKPRTQSAFYYIKEGSLSVNMGHNDYIINAGSILSLDNNVCINFANKTKSTVHLCIVTFNFNDNLVFEDINIPLITYDNKDLVILNMFNKMNDVFSTKGIAHIVKEKSILLNIIYYLINNSMYNFYPNNPDLKIIKAIEYINSKYKEGITLQDLSEKTNYSIPHLRRMFYKFFKISPIQYLNNLRIEKAKELLLMDNLPINYIAENVGFKNSSYFSRVFKKHTQLSPCKYKELFTQI